MSGHVCFNPTSSHSQWFIPIPSCSHSHSGCHILPVHCGFAVDRLLVVEILKVEDTTLLSWWAVTVVTVECVTVRRSSRRRWCSTTDWLVLFLWVEKENVGFSFLPFPSRHSHFHSHSHQISLWFPIPWDSHGTHKTHGNSQYRLICNNETHNVTA